MALLGGKSVARRSMQVGASGGAFTGRTLAGGAFTGRRFAGRNFTGRRGAAAACMLVAAVWLSACEYAELEPLPGASTAALPSVLGHGPASPSAQEEARQRELIADVEEQLGPETDRRVASMLGGMGNTGASLMGLVPDHGSYLIRAACSSGPAAKLTISQGGVQLLDLQVPCGGPFESTLQLTAGRVTATLAPTSSGESSVAALRIEKAPAEPLADPPGAAPESGTP